MVVAFRLAGADEALQPSKPEERQRAVIVAHVLEEAPLGPSAVEDRAWILSWVERVPDINVYVCLELIDPLLNSKKPNSDALTLQLLISSTAFIIENPGQASDQQAISVAGLNGLLRTYSHVIQANPKSRIKFLDTLAAKDTHELAAFVSEGVAKCAKDR
jgi:hypothetical protein